MKKTRTTRSASPFLASSSTHTICHTAKPHDVSASSTSHWPMVHSGLRTNNIASTSASTVVMVQEDGHCELSLDGGSSRHDALMLDYQGTPVMGGGGPRYVAGNAFFNYQLYGGIRKGGSVSFLSPCYRGYALAAFLSGYVYVAVMYLLTKLPDDALSLEKSTYMKGMLSLQWTVVLLVGVVSDAFAPFGLRRKSYIIAGWSISSLLWLALFLLFQFGSPSPPPTVTIALITLAFLFLIIATNALDIRIIELSQQEELQLRGRLLGSYEMLRISAQLVMHAVIALIVTPDKKTFDIHLPFRVDYVFLHLAVVCALPIYWLLHNAEETNIHHRNHHPSAQGTGCISSSSTTAGSIAAPPSAPLSHPATTHFRMTWKELWNCTQQKVVWQLMVFNCLVFFFALFEIQDTRRAVQFWCKESSLVRLVRNCVGDAAFVIAIFLWRTFGINANWRKLTVCAILCYAISFSITSSLAIYDIVRGSWLTTLAWMARAPLRVLMLLAAFVPCIEIAPAGTEGTTYALLAVTQSISKALAGEISKVIVDHWHSIEFSYKALQESSRQTQNAHFCALVAMMAIVLSVFLWLFLLPQQKLDAQQLRVYGGYSTLPVVLLSVGFATAFPYVCYLQISQMNK